MYKCDIPGELVPFGHVVCVQHVEVLLKDVEGGHVALLTRHI